jgi:lipopolysaccharide export system permease protein
LTAKSGDISYSKDYSKVIIELYDGEIHLLNKQNVYEDYRKVLFTKHIVSINAEGFGFSKSDENALSRGDRELSADSMRNIVNKIQSDYEIDKAKSVEAVKQLALDYQNIKFKSEIKADSVKNKANELFVQSLQNRYRGFRTKYMSQKQMELSNHRQTDTYLVEIYKKYSIPFACVVFVMIGAPLGVITRRGGFGVAAGMSLGFFLLYWSCLIGGEKLADREMLSPFLSMWTANFVLGAVGLYLTFRNSINFKKIFKRI